MVQNNHGLAENKRIQAGTATARLLGIGLRLRHFVRLRAGRFRGLLRVLVALHFLVVALAVLRGHLLKLQAVLLVQLLPLLSQDTTNLPKRNACVRLLDGLPVLPGVEHERAHRSLRGIRVLLLPLQLLLLLFRFLLPLAFLLIIQLLRRFGILIFPRLPLRFVLLHRLGRSHFVSLLLRFRELTPLSPQVFSQLPKRQVRVILLCFRAVVRSEHHVRRSRALGRIGGGPGSHRADGVVMEITHLVTHRCVFNLSLRFCGFLHTA
mmetsp:Transcript_18336/g.51732  ORF Transcript_18336/g.51732 Transcript_18336/m.51732 type:complete len:265 (-) Transcript_18336:113-907(-)